MEEMPTEPTNPKPVEEIKAEPVLMKTQDPDFYRKVLIATLWMVGFIFFITGLYVTGQIGNAKSDCINIAYQSFAKSYCNATPQFCDCSPYGGCYIKGVQNQTSLIVLNRTGE